MWLYSILVIYGFTFPSIWLFDLYDETQITYSGILFDVVGTRCHQRKWGVLYRKQRIRSVCVHPRKAGAWLLLPADLVVSQLRWSCHFIAVMPLVNRLATASGRSSNIGPRKMKRDGNQLDELNSFSGNHQQRAPYGMLLYDILVVYAFLSLYCCLSVGNEITTTTFT